MLEYAHKLYGCIQYIRSPNNTCASDPTLRSKKVDVLKKIFRTKAQLDDEPAQAGHSIIRICTHSDSHPIP